MKSALRFSALLGLSFLSIGSTIANKKGNDPSHAFIPNEGQWDRRVEYRADIPGGKFFAQRTGFTYLLHDLGKLHDMKRVSEDLKINYHSIKVRFPGSKGAQTIREKGGSSYPINYYLSDDPNEWATGLHKYQELDLEGFYKGVDMRLAGMEKGFKYEFRLEAGVDPDPIKMVVKGASSLSVEDGRLKIGTSLRPIIEETPFAYQ